MIPPREERAIDTEDPAAEMPAAAHVLAVEDDAGMRRLITRILQENAFRVSGARNGIEMWDALDRLPIDLVLLDVMLPGTSGMDLCRALRQKSNVPIVMVTARDAETDRVVEAVQRSGECWMGATTWHGQRLMRISVSSWRTTEADVDRSVAAILAAR